MNIARVLQKILQKNIMVSLFRTHFVCLIFTTLRGMQSRSSDENSVCPSVKREHCDKTEERSVQLLIPYKRSFLSFSFSFGVDYVQC